MNRFDISNLIIERLNEIGINYLKKKYKQSGKINHLIIEKVLPLDISNNLPINKYRLVKAYELRGKSKIFLNQGEQKIKLQNWDFYWKAKKLNYWKAILDFSKALEIDPKDSLLYFWRGFAYEFLEEYPNAVKDLKIANNLDPEFPLTKSLLEHIESKGFK